jgi:hypothetical protein
MVVTYLNVKSQKIASEGKKKVDRQGTVFPNGDSNTRTAEYITVQPNTKL